MRDNSAVNGGALYCEGLLTVDNAVAERNIAERCGGLLYSAHGCRAHFKHCEIKYNHDSCGRAHIAPHHDGPALGAPGTPLALPGGRVGGGPVARQGIPAGGGARPVDVSGAIAEGPSLLQLSSRAFGQASSEAREGSGFGSPGRKLQGGGSATLPMRCEPKRHGGPGGQPHRLSCGGAQWRHAAGEAVKCTGWRQTGACRADGPREPDFDLTCFEFVPAGVSGYCACGGGIRAVAEGCGQKRQPFTCQQACRERLTAGSGPEPITARTPIIVGAFGFAATQLDAIGFLCSDGSSTGTSHPIPLDISLISPDP